jgi:hypothetical protein
MSAREQLTVSGQPVVMAASEDQFADLHKLQEAFDTFMLLDGEAQLEFLRQHCHFKWTVEGLPFIDLSLAPGDLDTCQGQANSTALKKTWPTRTSSSQSRGRRQLTCVSVWMRQVVPM